MLKLDLIIFCANCFPRNAAATMLRMIIQYRDSSDANRWALLMDGVTILVALLDKCIEKNAHLVLSEAEDCLMDCKEKMTQAATTFKRKFTEICNSTLSKFSAHQERDIDMRQLLKNMKDHSNPMFCTKQIKTLEQLVASYTSE